MTTRPTVADIPRLLDYVRGDDDSALRETVWPLVVDRDRDVEWLLRYGTPTRWDMLAAAEVIAAYRALIEDGTTKTQLKRLAALRRVAKRRRRP